MQKNYSTGIMQILARSGNFPGRSVLNEFKLKQGFKAYYGTTVYGYITRLRMETAKKMILYDRKSIGEVAPGGRL